MSIQLKRSNTANIDGSIVLLSGQPGVEMRGSQGPRMKIGDGVTDWDTLPYLNPDPSIYTDTGIQFDYDVSLIAGTTSIAGNNSGASVTADPFVINVDGTYYYFYNGSISPVNLSASLGTSSNRFSSLYLNNSISISARTSTIAPTLEFYTGNSAASSLNRINSRIGVKAGTRQDANLYVYVYSTSPTGMQNQIGGFQFGWGSFSGWEPIDEEIVEGTGTLGSPALPWATVYATTGSIQTSDRASKSDIHYIDSVTPYSISTFSTEVDTSETLTTQDIIDFIKSLDPASFVYKYKDITSISEAETDNMELIQVGLIADDIQDQKLFKYIGYKNDYSFDVPPVYEEDGETVKKEGYTKTGTALGLKVLPLTIVALTACKDLINRVEQLESK